MVHSTLVKIGESLRMTGSNVHLQNKSSKNDFTPMSKEELKKSITSAPKVSSSSGHLMTPQQLADAITAQNAFEGRLNAFATGEIPVMNQAKTISQSTFEEAVQENIDEFSMERADAILAAKSQFEAQGIKFND